jgi:hypothetical protein
MNETPCVLLSSEYIAMDKRHLQMVIGPAQYIAGGALTVLATRLSETYGPSFGALIWVFPTLLYVSLAGMAASGESTKRMASFCYASFPTTMVNAISILLLGWFVTKFPGAVWKAIVASIVVCFGVGLIIRKLL